MKTLSDWIVAIWLVLIVTNTIIHNNSFETLCWMALGFALRFIWDNRHENIFDWGDY